MGIYPQPNLWQCGPFALKHALITLGILEDEREISALAGARWWAGADEIQLGRAARRLGCDLRLVRRYDAGRARRELAGYLNRGIPVLLCVDGWGHWLTAVKAESGKFILLDSHEPRVLTIATWRALRRRWVFAERDPRDTSAIQEIYDLHPVMPRERPRTRARFSLSRARALRQPSKKRLADRWDAYLEDLLALCAPRTPLSERVVSMGEFFRRHGTMILEEVDYWHGGVQREKAKTILDDLHFVADTYGLVVHEEAEKRAIAGISALLALWAAGEYGVNRSYGANGRRPGGPAARRQGGKAAR